MEKQHCRTPNLSELDLSVTLTEDQKGEQPDGHRGCYQVEDGKHNQLLRASIKSGWSSDLF